MVADLPAHASEERAMASTQDDVVKIGSIFAGRYRISRFLGEGDRKRTYLADDTVFRRQKAGTNENPRSVGRADRSARHGPPLHAERCQSPRAGASAIH